MTAAQATAIRSGHRQATRRAALRGARGGGVGLQRRLEALEEVRRVLGHVEAAQGGAHELVAVVDAHAGPSAAVSALRRAARARFSREATVPRGTPRTDDASW